MGDYIMKFLLFSAILVIAASASFEDTPENVLVEASADITALKKKGATEADCKDPADKTCKEVYTEVSTAQNVINRQSSGSHCEKLGEKGYIAAKNEYNKVKTQWVKVKNTVLKLKGHTWKETLTYDKLRPGKCGFIFSSKEYLTTYRQVHKAIRLERVLMGKITETRKWMITMLYRRNKARFNCRCAVLKTRNAIWARFTKNRAKQQKALSKCKMMKCVLNSTPVSSRKCRAVLPKLKNKVLTKIIEWSHKTGICRRKWLKEREHKTAVRLAEKHRKAEKKVKIERQIKLNRERQTKQKLRNEKMVKARSACANAVKRAGMRKTALQRSRRATFAACKRQFGSAWTTASYLHQHYQPYPGGGWPAGTVMWTYCEIQCTRFYRAQGLVTNRYGMWVLSNRL